MNTEDSLVDSASLSLENAHTATMEPVGAPLATNVEPEQIYNEITYRHLTSVSDPHKP